ncbi:gamma carbonic anhydrase family protein [Sphingomonas endophytica]|uniref:Acetyltransferase n=1 Tax=Sphingomonas endophytica TaxID=869719 RepID=A0A147HVJ5_9SPHN|nr:gamma carbonic anhydrase family protein [Sphingomonas endophytica]KTT68956.1 acetyltransferase [Sphingomonas endophytica]
MPLYAFKGQRPTRHPTAWVAPSADVIGDVVLGEGVGVWFGAVIRGDNTTIPIGARSNVQEGAMLHSDPGAPLTVGEDCTIGHHAVLHGCSIGDRVLIGMGAIVLNRAVIADDCIVGAGALVTEGKTFPPRSLIVGSPARVVRELDDAAVAALKLSAAHYVANAHAASEGLERVE